MTQSFAHCINHNMLYSTDIGEFGKIEFHFNEDGTFQVGSEFGKRKEFIVVIKSLDCNLTTDVCYHDCSAEHNYWTYNFNVFVFKEKDHPGFKIEVYDKTFKTLLHEKSFHKNKRSVYLDLKSNIAEVTYNPYYSLFYEKEFTDNIKVRDGDVVYDLGANVGVFSLMCSNYDVKAIYAFEPQPENFQYLKQNCDRYGKNVTCFEKAVFNDFKQLSFGGGGSVGGSIKDNGEYKVDGINLEKFVHVNNLKKPTFFKIDIEGGEYDVLSSTSDEFFSDTHTVLFEFHYNNGTNVQTVIDRFTSIGFTVAYSSSLTSSLGTVFLTR